ncbi:LysM peptidoglycan-binding domain-containing protein [Sphingomonas koreensis]|uniref:LysM peptidoglycan-binding domain-containing protein n=1 Tax=Sphingomonas koreensis TaxID=93064 RepID=A0A430FZ64_9SPHN|nr:LysM peptidoglycan-binding domain-containing protein [Sphingomonas koreensis]RSY78556.1 LysM peptidoglycan-binding domain-containing protein [Sphingomonas koreensis]
MVAIFTGAGTGFERGSGNVIGGGGLLGSAAQGRGGDNIFLNAANGNLLISRQDEFLSGRGPDVGITRTYNSLGNFSDDNGDNWRQSMDRAINPHGPVNDWGGTVVRRGGDGAEVTYSWNGSAYVATDGAGSYDTITFDGSTWLWRDGDSRVTETYEFAPFGSWRRILAQTDTSGNSLTFSYTGANLTRVTTADGGYTEINWSGSNIYALYTYSHGTGLTRTRYSYDGYNRLSTVTVDLTPNDTTTGDGNVYTTSYTYHGTSKLVATIEQTDGSYVAFTYDGSNRVTSIAETVSSGVTRTTGIAYGAGSTTVTDPMGQSTTLHYDGNGQLIRVTAPPATAGAAPQTIEFGYNANGDLIRTTDAGGKVTSYTYDASGNLLTRSDATSVAIQNGINAIATLQPDGTYRVTKTGGSSGTYDAQVQSSQGISGDFVFRLRPLQTDKYLLAGVAQNPNASLSYTGLDFAIEAAANGYMYHYDNGVYAQLTSYVAGDSLWMVRTGSTLSYYKGDTLEAAKAAAALRTVNGVSGTFYADAALYTIGAVADMSLTPTSIEESFNVVTRTYNAANQVLTETRMGSDRNSANAAHTTRYVYDSLNRLTYVVSAEGHVTRNWYDGYGLHYWTNDFPDHLYDVSGLAPNDAISDATLNSWAASLGDTSSTQISFVTHDARGNISLLRTATQNNSFGSMGYAEGYRDEFFTYDQSGRLLSRRTASQNSEYFAYDGLGRVTSSTDLNGGVTSIYFNDAATQTTVTLAGGLVQVSTYSKAGELLNVTESGAYATGGTANSVYDKNGRLRVTTDATGVTHYYLYDAVGRKTAEVNESGDLIEYRYDARNRLVATARFALRITDTAHFAALADPNSSIDVATIRPGGHVWDIWTWHIYDSEGRMLQAIDGDGSTTRYDYDASGQLIRTTGYFNKLTAAQIAAFKLAAPTGVVLPPADSRDTIARVFYDKDGRTIGALDGAGYLSRIAYDRAGRKVKEVAYAKATDPALRAGGTFQQLINSTGPNPDPANRQMDYVYDGQGLLRYQIDGLGQVTEYGYESDVAWGSIGLARKVTTYATAISFPSGLTFAAVKAAIASSGAASNTANRTSWAVYDTAGRVAYAIDAGGAVTGFSYDTSGRVTKKLAYANLRATTSLPTQADMNSWAAANPAATDRVTRYYYDAMGQLRLTIDAENYVTRTDYDAEGRVAVTYRYDTAVSPTDSWTIAEAFGALSGTHATNYFYYDTAGRLGITYDGESNRKDYVYYATGKLAYEYVDYGGPDQAWIIHEYDAAGRHSARYDAYGTPEQALTQFVYDGLGNLVLVSNPLNRTTTYTHDNLGRVLTETNAASGTTSYQYNAFGNVVRATDQRGNSTHNYYDSYGRVIASRDAEDYVTETSYTAFGEIATVTRRYNKATNTASVDTLPAYAAHGKDATTSFTYDKLGQVKTTTDAEGATETRWYNAFGQVDQTQSKLGLVVQYGHDRRGNVRWDYTHAAIFDSVGNQTASGFARNHYYYDARSNLVHQVEALGQPERRDTHFAYDKADRLISKTGGNVATGLSGTMVTPVETYAYDKRGNLIETIDAMGGRTLFYYDDLDRKVAQIDATGAVTQYIYDAAGNLKQTRAFDTLVTLPATPGGTLALPGGTARDTYYNYDNLNRLTSSYKDAGRTGYWNGLAFVTQTGPAFTYYEYDAAGNVIKTTDPNGATTFSYYDKLGRKTHEVDRENFLTKWEYDAEGNVLTERRYAIQGSTPTTAAPPVIGETASDRVTLFSYDKLGRRLTETRHGVEAWSIDTGTGTLTADNRNATITYTYNALGQVLTKTEANGDVTTYTYDNAGRLIKETRASYYDYTGALVAPELRYFYNGLDQLTFTRQVGSSLFHRTTSNTYEDGRLSSATDASGFTRNYHYDSMGRLVAESYDRQLSNGTTVREAIFYVHDAAGRVVTQSFARFENGSWTHTDASGQYYDATRMRYNAHGELTGRGITAGPWATAAYQEYYDYDASGRVLRSNAGDGVVKYFAYDKAGNQTLTLTSEGSVDLTAINYTDLIDAIDGNADTAHSGIAATLAVYDRRGMVTQTRAPGRNLSTTSSTTTDIIASRSYNAFGEVLSETDARGYTTSFTYNNMGRLLARVSPQVSVTSESGVVSTVNPTEHYRYDISGRLIGSVDANGNLTTRLLLAGTGHGGSEALTAKEFHADGGVLQTFYDGYGDARILRNELGKDEQHSYDGMGRVTQIIRRDNPGWGQLTEYFAYDGLGQRIQQWNSFQGSGNKALTDYDAQGRVISSVAIGGDTTSTSYQWSYTLATSGLGTFGGWTTTTTYHNGKTSIEKADMFGHTVQTTDMGGNVANMTFDKAGRTTARVIGLETTSYTWLNTGLIGKIVTGYGNPATAPVNIGETYAITVQTSAYDANGNKITEESHKEGGTWQWYDDGWWSYQYFEPSHQSLQNASATYDALNRLTNWVEAGTTTAAEASTAHAYDANGNIRRTTASFRHLDTHGAPYGYVTTTDHWYRYDSMNRVVTAKGVQTGSGIVRGGSGVDILYDTAGRRTQVTTTAQRIANATYMEYREPYWEPVFHSVTVPYEAEVRETYTYYNTGELNQVRIAETGYYDNQDGTITTTPPPAGAGALKASYWYDDLGRLERQIDWIVDPDYDPNAVNYAAYDRTITYNDKGQVETERVVQRDGSIFQVSETANNYGSLAYGNYALGAVVSSTTSVLRTNTPWSNSSVNNYYEWRDGAVLASTTLSGTTSGTTYYTRNGSGVLQEANIYDGRQRKVTFHNDVNGQVLRRNEQDYAATGDPQEIWYRFNGKQMGYIGNNGTLNTDYQSSVAGRELTQGSGAFRNGASYGGSYADFDQFYEGITSHSQGGAGGSYVVRGGETLAGLAAQLWGDSSLWYKLAEANGLSAGTSLVTGQTLHIPSGVSRSQHNATTFTPYDPAETLGDTSPTTPTPQKPKKGNKCGVFGQILMVAIAVAVTVALRVPAAKLFANLGLGSAVGSGTAIATAGAGLSIGATSAAGIAGTIGAAAVGSVASQAFGLATGIQQGGFNWKGVGLSAIGAGIGSGLGAISALKDIAGSPFLSGAVRGALGNALTQGIGIATGLQSKFDFAGVAVGAAVGGVVGGLGKTLGVDWDGGINAANMSKQLVASTAGAIAGSAARSLLTGSSFGDNILAALPDVIGSTIGGAVAGELRGAPELVSRGGDGQNSGYEIGLAGKLRLKAASFPGSEIFSGSSFAAHASESWRDWVTGTIKKWVVDPVTGARDWAGQQLDADGNGSFDGQDIVITGRRVASNISRIASFDTNRYVREFLSSKISSAINSANQVNINAQRSGTISRILEASGMPRAAAVVRGVTGARGQFLIKSLGGTANFAVNTLFGSHGSIANNIMAQVVATGQYAVNGMVSDIKTHFSGALSDVTSGNVAQIERGTRNFSVAGLEVATVFAPATKAGAIGRLRSPGIAGDVVVAAESRLVGGTFDVGVSGSQYTLRATLAGFEGATGTVNTRAFVVHGNSASSSRTAYLYELYQADGTFLKNGITQNMNTRYTKTFMEDKYMIEVASGPRRDMILLERQRTIANPGPLNREPWAIKARNGQ